MPGVESTQPIGPIQGTEDISSSAPVSSQEKPDIGISTIEESKLVASLLLPLVSSFPLLPPPKKDDGTVDGLSSILTSMNERKKMNFLFGLMSQMREITSNMNKTFADNLKAIEEETKRIINSSDYRYEEEIRKKGDPHRGKVSGGMTPTAALGAAPLIDKVNESNKDSLISVDRLDKLSQKVKEKSNLEIPFTVLFTVAGSLALGKMSMKNDAVDDLAKFVEKIQPVVQQVKVEEIQPLINLMVMALIIFRPLDEGISNIKENEQHSFAKRVEDFAKDVIKMVSDPTFALLTIVNNIEKVDNLNPEQKRNFLAMLKLILASVALSLLYSLEGGKIQGDKFFGMEPIEFRALLDPNKPLLQVKPEEKMTSHENLMWSLINVIRAQIAELPPETVSSTIDAVLGYMEKRQNVGKLLDPSKVLVQVLQSMNYKTPLPDPLYV